MQRQRGTGRLGDNSQEEQPETQGWDSYKPTHMTWPAPPLPPLSSDCTSRAQLADMSLPGDKHAIVEDEILKEKLNDGVDRHLEVHMPQILRGLSPEEIDRLDKSVTRKLDLTMLPVVMFMFFL